MDNERLPTQHIRTPQKNRIIGGYEEWKRNPLPTENKGTLAQFFQRHGVSRATGYRLINSESDRYRPKNDQRGVTYRTITPAGLRLAEDFIQNNGFDGRILTYQSIVLECELSCSARTLRRHLRTLNYRRCVACSKSWVSPFHADRRSRWAREQLELRPEPEDWDDVRFSDENHQGFGPGGRQWVIRKPGERECPDCLNTKREPRQEDEKKVHTWGVIGYDYQSKLYRYTVPNKTGKMNMDSYLKLLKEECSSWPSHWTLEEDGDSSHGIGKNNPVRAWKEKQGLKYYFNCPQSPDLSPIENAWRAPKEAVQQQGHWDDETVWELAQEGWDGLHKKTINKWCRSMPERLRHVVELNGQMTAF